MSKDFFLGQDLRAVVSKINVVFGSLSKRVWSQNLKHTTKLVIYKSMILPILLYGCEILRRANMEGMFPK